MADEPKYSYSIEELVDGEWVSVHVPPDPGLEEIDDDSALNDWFDGLDGL